MAHVVVGTGRSASSDGAVRWSAEAAALRGVALTLLHVWPGPVDIAVAIDPTAGLGLPPGTTARATPGVPATVLLAEPADVLALGLPAQAQRPPRLLRLVVHAKQSPVVLVPQHWQPTGGAVVVGVCGTPAAAAALQWAAAEAQRRAADLVVVHSWQVLARDHVRELRNPRQGDLGRAGAVLDRVHGWVEATLGPREVTVSLSRGPRLEALLDPTPDAALLVLGRGVHSRLDRMLTGAVGDGLAALAGCPVAVVPDPVAVRASSTRRSPTWPTT